MCAQFGLLTQSTTIINILLRVKISVCGVLWCESHRFDLWFWSAPSQLHMFLFLHPFTLNQASWLHANIKASGLKSFSLLPRSSTRSSNTPPPCSPFLPLLPLPFPLMCNKQRLCTTFTRNILCLVSRRCTQNSCCSFSSASDCQAFESYLGSSKKQKAQRRLKKHTHTPTPPPLQTQTSSRQQRSVLHKKKRGRG